MKGFILSLALFVSSSAFANVHPASDFVAKTLTKAMKILDLKSDEQRARQMCTVFKQTMALSHVGSAWLGSYANLKRDQAGVRQFQKQMPSIMVTQLFPALGIVEGGTFRVNPKATDLGNGRYQVAVTVKTTDGKTYNVRGKVGTHSGKLLLMDVSAMGISAVGYIGKDFKNRFDDEYAQDPQNSLPVSAVLSQIMSSEDFIRCS